MHPGDVARVRQEWDRASAADAELRTDFRLSRHAGPLVWVHAAVTVLADQDDLPRGFLVALTNVTARKRAEQERDRLLAAEQAAVRDLTDQTERLNSLIAAAIPGVLVLDERHMIVNVNQSLCDLLGIEGPPAAYTGTDAEILREPIARAFGESAEVMHRMTHAGCGPAAGGRPPVRGLGAAARWSATTGRSSRAVSTGAACCCSGTSPNAPPRSRSVTAGCRPN